MARRIRVETVLPAPPEVVWADLRDISTHTDWMADAVAIRFHGDQREGVGTSFDTDTKVGPIRLTDRMVVTEWVDEREMGVRHVGLVTGEGLFTLNPTADGGTEFVWEETLTFPWWLGGPIGEIVGAPVLRWIWNRNLASLRRRFASGTASTGV